MPAETQDEYVSQKEAKRVAKQQLKAAKAAYKDARQAAGKSPMSRIIAILILSFSCVIGGAAVMWYYMDGKHQAEIVALQERSVQLAAQASEKAEAEKEAAVKEAAKNAAAEKRAKDKQEAAEKEAADKAKKEKDSSTKQDARSSESSEGNSGGPSSRESSDIGSSGPSSSGSSEIGELRTESGRI